MAYKKIRKNCASCGIEFIASRPSVKYCGKGCDKKGAKSPNWKGNNVSIKVLHKWVESQLGRPECCSKCGNKGKVDLANISNDYKRDILDWEWLCRKCHMKSDGRLEKFLSHSIKKRLPNRNCVQCGKEYKPTNSKSKFCSMSCRTTNYNLNHKKYGTNRTH